MQHALGFKRDEWKIIKQLFYVTNDHEYYVRYWTMTSCYYTIILKSPNSRILVRSSNKKYKQLNLCSIISILIFNELYLLS